MATRTVKAPEERRGELMTAAQHLFYTKGYQGTSVSDIVTAVGVAQGTFYYYFDSKEAVLRALVDDMVEQGRAFFHTIVSDPALSAIPKWQQAIQLTTGWKLERKEQLLTLNRMLAMDENILLRHTLVSEQSKAVAAELAPIIAQGVDEGVFDVVLVPETARLVMALIFSLSDTMSDLILSPEPSEEQIDEAMRHIQAVQTGIERLLGAPSRSLPIIDETTLRAWLDD